MAFCLGSIVRRAAFRRFVAVACALAFLAVSFAHIAHHAAFVSEGAAVEMSAASDAGSDEADGTKKTPALEHCHGCMMVAIGSAELPAFADIGADVVQQRLVLLRSIPHSAEYPPPKA